jgi:hypothetical protein
MQECKCSICGFICRVFQQQRYANCITCPLSGQATTGSLLCHHALLACHSGTALDRHTAVEVLASYLDRHKAWFTRCAEPMAVEDIGTNSYSITLGRGAAAAAGNAEGKAPRGWTWPHLNPHPAPRPLAPVRPA